jgi:hypothetical protein
LSRERENRKIGTGCQFLEVETSKINGLSHYSKIQREEYGCSTIIDK